MANAHEPEPEPGLAGIRAFIAIDDVLATSGQPTREQVRMLRAAGFDSVLNLAVATSEGALPDEPELVRSHGMEHAHVPVDFERPTDADVEAFFAVMERWRGRRVLVHCALNMRASAFVFLWRVLRCGEDRGVAQRRLNAVWQPDGAWAVLLERWLATVS
jgi:protein tyrosine phosphatase (PTP) superfamily phosphohydrolase (DUF442 family)